MLPRFLSPSRHPRPSRRQSDSENFLLSAFWPRRNCLPERFCCSPGRRPVVPAPQLGGGDAPPRRPGLAFPRPLGVTAPADLGTHVCGPGAHLSGSSRAEPEGQQNAGNLPAARLSLPPKLPYANFSSRPPAPEPGSVSPEASAFAAADALGPGVRGSAATAGAASRHPSEAASCPSAGSRTSQPASAGRLAAGALRARSPARASRRPPPPHAAPPGGGRAKGRVCPASRGSVYAPGFRLFSLLRRKKRKRGGALVNRPPPS